MNLAPTDVVALADAIPQGSPAVAQAKAIICERAAVAAKDALQELRGAFCKGGASHVLKHYLERASA